MAIKDKSAAEDLIEWTVDVEVQLFYAMRGHKPVGVNRHFQMACILDKFRHALRKEIGSKQIWDHLETMYDMSALHESEIVPFPNDETDFFLPDREYGLLLRKEENKHNREQKMKENMQKEEREKKEEKELKEKSSAASTANKSSQNSTNTLGKHHHYHHSSHHHHHNRHQDDQKKISDQGEEKETPKSGKPTSIKPNVKDRHRETREVDSPKRKRVMRGNQEGKSSPKETPPTKRRRT